MRSILQYPDSVLGLKSELINEHTPIDSIINDMKFYLKRDNSVGLAAPQLGELIRLVGVKFGNDIIFLLNPEIVKVSDKMFPSHEGCLSINQGCSEFIVKRYKLIKVKAMNQQFQSVTYKGRGLFGRVLQHEIDHLDGKLINDKHSATYCNI